HFDGQSFVEINYFDATGKLPLSDPSGAASTSMPVEENGNTSLWILHSASLGDKTKLPETVTVRCRYSVGSWENTNHVRTTFFGTMGLEGGSQLNGVGQNANGKCFVAISIGPKISRQRQFGVVAITKNGRELKSFGSSTGGTSDGTGALVQQFIFDVPLADIAYFSIGTRPIRAVEWKDVVLPKRKN
ncbi:MAG: hypothetical protein ACR2H1_04350, partial [Limisphaerales bacterium]